MTAQAKPFTFNTSFDPPSREEIEAARQAELERQRQEEERLRAVEEEEVAPSFSEEEMEAAKQESYDRGRQDAMREMEVHAEQIIAVTQQSVASKLEQIFKIQEQAAHIAERNTVELANSIVRALLPTLVAENGLPEIVAAVRQTLEQFRDEPSVTIRVHPDYEQALSKAADDMASRGLFRGTVHIVGEPDVAAGDCRIEWDGGGAERNMSRLLEEVGSIVEKTLEMMDQFDGPYEPIARPEPTPAPQEVEAEQAVTLEPSDNIDLFGDDEEPEDDKIELFDDEEPTDQRASEAEPSVEMEATDGSAENELAEMSQDPETASEQDAREFEPDAAAKDTSGVDNG